MKTSEQFIKIAREQAPDAFNELLKSLHDQGLPITGLPLAAVVVPAAQFCLMQGQWQGGEIYPSPFGISAAGNAVIESLKRIQQKL